jgi:hypothetical protein
MPTVNMHELMRIVSMWLLECHFDPQTANWFAAAHSCRFGNAAFVGQRLQQARVTVDLLITRAIRRLENGARELMSPLARCVRRGPASHLEWVVPNQYGLGIAVDTLYTIVHWAEDAREEDMSSRLRLLQELQDEVDHQVNLMLEPAPEDEPDLREPQQLLTEQVLIAGIRTLMRQLWDDYGVYSELGREQVWVARVRFF